MSSAFCLATIERDDDDELVKLVGLNGELVHDEDEDEDECGREPPPSPNMFVLLMFARKFEKFFSSL